MRATTAPRLAAVDVAVLWYVKGLFGQHQIRFIARRYAVTVRLNVTSRRSIKTAKRKQRHIIAQGFLSKILAKFQWGHQIQVG